MEGYVLGIDNGGSGVKAVLFDLAGREVSGAKRSIEMQTPAPATPSATWSSCGA